MKIRNLIQVGVMGMALAMSASAQQYNPQYDGRAERVDIKRDLHRRDELVRRVEADRRAVEHERRELRHSNWFNSGHESRELRQAQDRLNRDLGQLRAIDEHIARDTRRLR